MLTPVLQAFLNKRWKAHCSSSFVLVMESLYTGWTHNDHDLQVILTLHAVLRQVPALSYYSHDKAVTYQ